MKTPGWLTIDLDLVSILNSIIETERTIYIVHIRQISIIGHQNLNVNIAAKKAKNNF